MRILTLSALGACGLIVALTGFAQAGEMKWGSYQVGDIRSGYTYATKETRAMQDDDLMNPAMIWVDQGEELWSKADGDAGKACQDCHQNAEDTMKGVSAKYPVVHDKSGKLMDVTQRINECRTDRMKAKPWKSESNQMLGMTAYVGMQSRGMPSTAKIDGAAKPFFEQGKAFFYQRLGLLDMSCSNCHEDNAGNTIRANLLSQGQSNGFPTYRLKWQKVGSLHRRFKGCNKNIRAQPYKSGSDEYKSLELFMSSRGRGLPGETPAVRN